MRRWDIFCSVVDNFGDIGTCWRLAQQLAGEQNADVRLWVDDLEAFASLCPSAANDAAVQQVGLIEICHWTRDFPTVEVADVVIEAFACEIPASYINSMTQRAAAPVWINLEYLSAEDWVDGCHALASPHPRLPLTKYFFFPGFTSQTGGLIRESGLLAARAAFDNLDAEELWRSVNIAPPADELRISLFCYENPSLPELLQCWADGPGAVRVLAFPGPAIEQTGHWFGQILSPGSEVRRGMLTVHALPFLSFDQFDRLLWACDANFVRGEDSFVRAQWAQRPFVWQIYPQSEGTHGVKLDAFLSRYLCNFPEAEVVRRCWQAWNGCNDIATAWHDFVAIRQLLERHSQDWAGQLDRLGDLANNLAGFVLKIEAHTLAHGLASKSASANQDPLF